MGWKRKILDVSGGHPILFQRNLYHDPLLRDLQSDECCLYRNLYHRICYSGCWHNRWRYRYPVLLFGASGVASHKGAYRALLKVRCMVIDHMAKVPLGALNERSTGEIKTVLNEDIEKLELFLAHNVPELICYLIGPVVVFIYLLTVNVPLALVSLVPLILALFVMCGMFMGASSMMGRANQSVANLNSVMVEYISGMKLIKAYNMGSKSFQKFSAAVKRKMMFGMKCLNGWGHFTLLLSL